MLDSVIELFIDIYYIIQYMISHIQKQPTKKLKTNIQCFVKKKLRMLLLFEKNARILYKINIKSIKTFGTITVDNQL